MTYNLPPNEDGTISFSREFALLEPYDAKGNYKLLEEFWIRWEHLGTLYRLRVPKCLITDVASVPRWAWSFSGITPDGLHRNAAIIHDIGYMWQGQFPPGWFQRIDMETLRWQDITDEKWSKDQIDKLFLRIMKACKVPEKTRKLMFYAVLIGAWPAWLKTDKSREKYRDSFISS